MTAPDLRSAAHAVLLASFAGPEVPTWLLDRIDQGLGGVCLFGSNLSADGAGRDAAVGVTTPLRAARADLLVATDEEGGDVTRLWATVGSTVPGNAALGAIDDVDLTWVIAEALGAELLAAGIDLVLAPVADVNAEPANPVIGVRSFGADADLVARHVASAVRGFQAAGVAACAKHFPGHGATRVDSHHGLPVVDVPAEVVARRELVPFRSAVEAGVAAVMTAHLVVPALDAEPATFSRVLLGNVLRRELGFDGAIVTDALDMRGAGGPDAIPGAVARAIAAGADLCCLGSEGTDELVRACVDELLGAVDGGALPAARLLDAASRVAHIRRVPPSAPRAGRGLVAVGQDAARRALRIDGVLAPVATAVHVVELDRPAMVAAGSVPWSVGAAMGANHDGVTVEQLRPEATTGVEAILRRAEGRGIVIVVRDPCRYAEQAALLRALLAARPDAVVVDVGWPTHLPGVTVRISTFGASAAATGAAAHLLSGLDSRKDHARHG